MPEYFTIHQALEAEANTRRMRQAYIYADYQAFATRVRLMQGRLQAVCRDLTLTVEQLESYLPVLLFDCHFKEWHDLRSQYDEETGNLNDLPFPIDLPEDKGHDEG